MMLRKGGGLPTPDSDLDLLQWIDLSYYYIKQVDFLERHLYNGD